MKKLYRSRTNRIIGGVAGGLAEYFDIDPIIVRLVTFGLMFSGAFLIAYIAAWIFVPLAPEKSAL
ncbi:TPA: PspC domain-containing protein [Candidatus Kaiserbacteria bacterium]|nr:MAG: Phage shock protein C, PspC [Parcubacteria group bacterium GW2011_GWA1_56_13]KKW46241.1 MAG: Phage shock protein C, PspC [Parcubacteria group bacterium GW2011_GWB1_57_6]HCR52692.1 PspC domain-containing protein [Candidatus Kaiserbacteria bacterium]